MLTIALGLTSWLLLCVADQIDFGDSKALYNCKNYNAPFFTGTKTKLQNVQKRRHNSYVGTRLYIAPEMISTQESGAFSDFWALGVIIYEMACGRPPFLGRDEVEVYGKIQRC